jgi:hypothetical protein
MGADQHGGPGQRRPSGKCMSWEHERRESIVPLPPPSPMRSRTSAQKEPPPSVSGDCGSRGGPGYRLASGQCASWDDEERAARQVVYDRDAHEQAAKTTQRVADASGASMSNTRERTSGGCGSRGGPGGSRLANGKCPSWHRKHK